MKTMNRKLGTRALAVALAGAILLPIAAAAQATVVKVVADRAVVRLKPDLASPMIGQVTRGTLLESKKKVQEWFAVALPPDEDGIVVSGYIHQSLVEVLGAGEPPPEAAVPEPAPEPEETPPARAVEEEQEEYRAPARRAPRPTYGRSKIVAGTYLKFGWMTSPDPGGFSNGWLADIGFDLGLGRNIGVGLEFQPAYRSYADLGLTSIPVMGFANLKAGLNLGSLLPFLRFLNVVGGGGLGAEAVYNSLKIEGRSGSEFKTRFAFHFLAAAEIDLAALRLVAEYQMAQVKDPAVTPSSFSHYVLFGIRF